MRRLHVNVQIYTCVIVMMSSVCQCRAARSRTSGKCYKRALCLCHRSDYLPSFHHKFKENNHGFVSSSHARPLRPKNAGENQYWRESKTGTSGSTKLHTPCYRYWQHSTVVLLFQLYFQPSVPAAWFLYTRIASYVYSSSPTLMERPSC